MALGWEGEGVATLRSILDTMKYLWATRIDLRSGFGVKAGITGGPLEVINISGVTSHGRGSLRAEGGRGPCGAMAEGVDR